MPHTKNKETTMAKENNETTETTERTAPNRDWKHAGLGALPPFGYLAVGDEIHATITAGRVLVKMEKDKKGREIENRDEVLHLTLLDEATISRGSERKKTATRVKMNVGDVFALAVGGNMSSLLRDIVKDKSGVVMDKDADVTEEDMKPLAGVEVLIKRIPDDVIKKGKWSGNPVKRYEVKYR